MAVKKQYSRSDDLRRAKICSSIATALREFGYPTATTTEVESVLDSWIDGKRDSELPNGVIGIIVGKQLDEVDETNPGSLAMLRKPA